LTNHRSTEVEKLEPLNPHLHGEQPGLFACLLVLSEHVVPNGCHKDAMFRTVRELVSSREPEYSVGNPAIGGGDLQILFKPPTDKGGALGWVLRKHVEIQQGYVGALIREVQGYGSTTAWSNQRGEIPGEGGNLGDIIFVCG
jgi:hypothetical protein